MSDFGSKSLPEITCYCTRFGAASPGLRSGSLAGLVTGRAWPEPLLLGASGGTGAVDRGGRGLGLTLGDPWTSGQSLGAPGGRAGPLGGQKGLWRHLLEAGLHGSLWGARPKGHIKSPLDGTGVDTGGRGWPGWTEGLSNVGRVDGAGPGSRGRAWEAGLYRQCTGAWASGWGEKSWRPCLEAETGRLQGGLTPGRRGPSGRPDGPGGEAS